MDYHIFNIGRPHTTAWWKENLTREVITAGYNSDPGDRGEVILRDMDEDDWVIAYCNGHGFVGAGIVLPIDTYLLHDKDVPGSLSNHRHERGIRWVYAVDDVANAVTIEKAGRHHAPRQTKERERNVEAAKRILTLLAAYDAEAGRRVAKHWHVLEAVQAIRRPCSISEIRAWLAEHYPDEDSSDARYNAISLTVNDANRRHYDRSRKSFRSDQGNPKDMLYREDSNNGVIYQAYRPAVHGVWDITEVASGNFEAVQLNLNSMELALAEAHQLVAEEPKQPIYSDQDARIRELRAVVLREGQGEFRQSLLDAYEKRCAMTGCAVVEILEAAHIKPYRGPDTNRTDNGLLLRADIHTLFDKGLIWLDDDLVIQISDRLFGSEYTALSGTNLRLPKDPKCRPHAKHVADHRNAIGNC